MQLEFQPDESLVRRSFGLTVKALDEEKRSVDVICSTETIDGYGEIVQQSWELGRYKKNPVLLYNHNSAGGWLSGPSAEETLPIGFAENVRVEDGALCATICFVDSKANPMAEKCFQSFKQGSMRAVSVGFMPGRVDEIEQDGKEILQLANNTLYEISVTPIPANPDAVMRSRAKAMEHLRAIQKRIEQHLEANDPPTTEVVKGIDTTTAADGRKEETAMDKIDELKATLEQKTAALVIAESKLSDATSSLTSEKKLREDFEARSKSLETQVETHVKGLGEAQKALKSMTDRAEAAELSLVEREVKELVGKKFYPAELEGMLTLAKKDKATFDVIVKARPDLNLSGPTMTPEPVEPRAKLGAPTSRKEANAAAVGGEALGELMADDDAA